MKTYFDVTKFINELSINCIKMKKKSFEKGEVITTYLLNRKQVCILIHGKADLIRYDFNGNKNIVERFIPGDVFGEAFYQINTNNDLFVLAKENSEVLFFNYDIFEKKCKKNCKIHQDLLVTLPDLVLSRITRLNLRIELLSKRTIRDKLLTYFTIISKRNHNKSFVLPFSLTELAEYLSVDRSAMMRELNNLKQEGLIKKDDNRITLLN